MKLHQYLVGARSFHLEAYRQFTECRDGNKVCDLRDLSVTIWDFHLLVPQGYSNCGERWTRHEKEGNLLVTEISYKSVKETNPKRKYFEELYNYLRFHPHQTNPKAQMDMVWAFPPGFVCKS